MTSITPVQPINREVAAKVAPDIFDYSALTAEIADRLRKQAKRIRAQIKITSVTAHHDRASPAIRQGARRAIAAQRRK